MMVSGASKKKKKNRAGGLRSCNNKPKEEWLGSSKVLGLLRLDLKSALFIFDLQHNTIIEENIGGGISWNMSDSLVVRDTSIYATGVFMDPDRYSYLALDKRDIDFFHLGTSVLDLNNNNKKWKEFAKMPPSTGTLQRPSSPILGHNIYVFQGTKALVYDINRDKWENLIHPPELLESRKSIIASYGRPLSRPELDSIQDPRTIRHPVISDTINNRLLVNFWYDLYAYYPPDNNEQESKWECLTHSKLGTPTICFRRPALVFDHVVYFYFPKQENSPYCIDAYDITTNKPINVLWSDDFHTDVYNDSLAQLARLDCFGYDTSRITLAHLGDGIMCLASCSQDDNSSTCLHFLRFRVQRLASLQEGVLITPVTAHQFTLPTCYRRIGRVIPL